MLGEARLPLLGRVSMDLVILDASEAPEVKVGDEVEFLGDHARLDDVATAAGTAPYEILTGFAGTIRRSGA
jgi:alanine racemase